MVDQCRRLGWSPWFSAAVKFVTWERWLCRFAVGRRGGVSTSFLALHRFLRTGGLEMVLRWRCFHCGKEMARGAIHAAFLLAHWWMCYACDDLVAVYERSCGVRSVLRPSSVLRGVLDHVLSRHKVVRSEVRSIGDGLGSALSGAFSSVLSMMLSNCANLVRSEICSARCARRCAQQAKCSLAKFVGPRCGGCRSLVQEALLQVLR